MRHLLMSQTILQDLAVERADHRRVPQGSLRVLDGLYCGQIPPLVFLILHCILVPLYHCSAYILSCIVYGLISNLPIVFLPSRSR